MTTDRRRAFAEFYRSARNTEVLEPKTTLMLHLAVAMAVSAGRFKAQMSEVKRRAHPS